MSSRLTRRAFLRSSFCLAGGALAASLPIAGCSAPAYSGAPAGLKLFTPRQWAVLDAAARRLVPTAPGRPGGGELGVATSADALFSAGNDRLKADLARLLDTLETMPWLAGRFTPFTRMGPEAQDAYLANWMGSGIGMKRQALAGLDRLVQTIYYMDPRSWEAIHFPGPWVGRLDVGLGLDNQGPLAANPNPHIYDRLS